MIYFYPAVAIVIQQNTQAPAPSFAETDVRLQREIPPKYIIGTNVSSVIKWAKSYARVSVGVEPNTVFLSKNSYIFGQVKIGDLMEAYSRLYKMRWANYKEGKYHYVLTVGRDMLDAQYAPQDPFQMKRFEATSRFIKGFDALSDKEKAKVLGGEPLLYTDLSPEMQEAFSDSVTAVAQGNAVTNPNSATTDYSFLSRGKISIKDESKPETGIRELWISFTSGVRDMSFRWNDYEKGRSAFPDSPRIAMAYEPQATKTRPRKEWVATFPKINQKVTVPAGKRSLSSLLRYLHTRYGINFITDFDAENKAVQFSCDALPLPEVMDRICHEYRSEISGSWDWDMSTGDFIVMWPKGASREETPKK